MKKFLLLSVCAAAFCITSEATAQTFKAGRVNMQSVVMSLPETDSAQVKVEAYAKELEEQMETMQVEYNTKLEDYNKNRETYSTTIATQKERELSDLGRRIQEFGQTAQEDLTNVQMAAMSPIITKVNNAVEKVANAQGLTVVFNMADASTPVYMNPSSVTDITETVVKELGGTLKSASTTAQ
ncbi:MAG TPA: OmpH family outer membrane protein [Candidatus Avirikenella pullistercoris]|nr:OmpH family outer membrane protein [Candidatus Avirikenella pullistercoris]